MSRQLALAILMIGLACLVASVVPAFGPQNTAYQDTFIDIAHHFDQVSAVYLKPAGWDPVNPAVGLKTKLSIAAADDKTRADITGLKPSAWSAPYGLVIALKDNSWDASWQLQVLDRSYGLLAAAGALLVILVLPIVIIRSSPLQFAPSRFVTGWTYLLMEPDGLSLARTQLIIFFVPVATVYVALSIPLHQFPVMPASVWQLLGIGGITTVFGNLLNPAASAAAPGASGAASASAAGTSGAATAAAPGASGAAGAAAAGSPALQPMQEAAAGLAPGFTAPPAPVAAATLPPDVVMVPPPRLRDLFEDASGFGDISRYQSFIIVCCTASVFLVSFFDTWTVPAIPPQVLQLLSASLAVYLGVKGIGKVRQDNLTHAAQH